MSEEHKKSAGLGAFSPAQTFSMGIIGGILVLCTIGFFIMLGIMMNSDGDDSAKKPANVVQVDKGNAQAPTPQVNGDIVVKPVDEKVDHIRGKKNAKVTIIEYSDFECTFCGRFHPTMNQISEKYSDDVRWVYRHFPLESIHPKARSLANASECAADQDMFWEMTDAIFEDTGASSAEVYATKIGLNLTKFNKCLADNKFDSKVNDDMQSGLAAGARGTPYSIILGPDGETVPLSGAQPLSAVDAAVAQFLN